jgi:hypothetical protein
MNEIERATKELAAAHHRLEALKRLPVNDHEFPNGTMIKWALKGNNPHVAIKLGFNCWKSTAYNSSNMTWDSVLTNLKAENLEFAEICVRSKSLFSEPVPELDILTPDQSGYKGLVLRDTRNNIAWERIGNTWERLYEE